MNTVQEAGVVVTSGLTPGIALIGIAIFAAAGLFGVLNGKAKPARAAKPEDNRTFMSKLRGEPIETPEQFNERTGRKS